jgi:hypothetical protein
MDLMILKKKIDGYRAANGSIKNLAPELLLELRQTWENFTGTPEEFRSELGVKAGTLRNLLVESKKLNHVIASAGAVGLVASEDGANVGVPDPTQLTQCPGSPSSDKALELMFDHGTKVIRFPNVDSLVDFLRKSA